MDYNQIRNSNRRKRGNDNVKMIVIIFAALIAVVLLAAGAVYAAHSGLISRIAGAIVPVETPVPTEEPTEAPTEAPAEELYDTAPEELPPEFELPPEAMPARGTSQVIPDSVRAIMAGVSMPANASISYDELRYLTIPHYDFNGNVAEGHMIVNAAVAEEVLDIFSELYDMRYPIERMELVDYYGGSDYDSIEHNNTSAFNYRESTDGSGRLSNHALGLAIDINPQINPYVNSSGTGSHSNAAEYWSRNPALWSDEVARAAYIGPDSYIYKTFVNIHGWKWGGNWSNYRDYQHFEKVLG